MTAAKSKTKRPDEKIQTTTHKEEPREKATSSRPEKVNREEKKDRPPQSESKEPCAGECKEICKAGPSWEECRLSCKVQTEHVSRECRCRVHVKKTQQEKSSQEKVWKSDTRFEPPTDTTLEAFKKESRFKIPSEEIQGIQDDKKKTYTVDEERRIKEAFEKAEQQARKTK